MNWNAQRANLQVRRNVGIAFVRRNIHLGSLFLAFGVVSEIDRSIKILIENDDESYSEALSSSCCTKCH